MPTDFNANPNADAPRQPPPPAPPPPIEGNKDGEGDNNANRGSNIEKTKPEPKHWTSYVEALCALALVFITFYYTRAAYRQLDSMNTTYGEIQKQTTAAQQAAYSACMNAQVAQATFLQIQRNSSDSHASTAATVEQAAADIQAERAIVTYNFRIPEQSEIVDGKFALPYFMKNEGKSIAFDVKFRAKAILANDADILKIDKTIPLRMTAKWIPPGNEAPIRLPDTNTPIQFIQVFDTQGQPESIFSRDVKRLNSGADILLAVFGTLEYSDFSGTHKTRFCDTRYPIRPGAMRYQPKNEDICIAYNHQEDHYTLMPTLAKYREFDTSQVVPITCIKPN